MTLAKALNWGSHIYPAGEHFPIRLHQKIIQMYSPKLQWMENTFQHFLLNKVAYYFTMDNHVEVPLMFSCLVGGHALEASRVGDLCARNNQPPTVGWHPQAFTLPDCFTIFIPPMWKNKNVLQSECVLYSMFLSVHEGWDLYLIIGAGVPVAWHSSSRGLSMITVLSVTSSAPSMKGGTVSRCREVGRKIYI